MKIGICTSDFQAMEAEKLFQTIADYGFVSVQLNFASVLEAGYSSSCEYEIPESISSELIECIKFFARHSGINITAINGTFNMAHPDLEVRQEGIRRFEVLAAAAVKLDCRIITLCSGSRNRTSMWQFHAENNTPAAWHDFLATIQPLVKIAERHGLALALETEVSNVLDTPEKVRCLLDEIGSGALKMIIDCANLFHPGKAHPGFVRQTIQHAFDLFGRDIILAHGKDIAESDDVRFCPTGKGIVDYAYFLELLKHYGYCGDMILHGLYDEKEIPVSMGFMRRQLAQYDGV